jgi:uncharacterized protein
VVDEIRALVQRRHAELDAAIGRRDWFDPWIYPLEGDDGDEAPPSDCLLPWVAGFATATELFPDLTAVDDPALVEPLALLFMHIDPDDLEDAEALTAVIETLEPPSDLAEAVQDTVRALMLIADVTRPRAERPALARPRPGARRPAAGRPAPSSRGHAGRRPLR